MIEKEYVNSKKREMLGHGDYVSEVVCEPKARNITSEVIDLRDLVSKAHEMFTVLDQKVQIIRCLAPTCNETKSNAVQSGSEVRETLAEQNDRLRMLIHRMVVMIDEIDL